MKTAPDTGPSAAFQGQTILVAEDEYFLATDLKRALTKAGALVIGPFPTVQGILEAIEKEQSFDAALLDINLRGEMSYPVADILRERGVAVVFMTGYDRAALPLAHQNVPICDKPVSIADFEHHLAALNARS